MGKYLRKGILRGDVFMVDDVCCCNCKFCERIRGSEGYWCNLTDDPVNLSDGCNSFDKN